METSFVYITAGSLDEARTIARRLVEERLAACVNIVENMHSLYWWEGKIQEDTEVILIAKTQTALVADLTRRVQTLHSYTVPCVVSLPIASGNPDFLDWIVRETKGGEPERG